VAGRLLADSYGDVGALISAYAIGNAPYFILLLILARYAATLQELGDMGGIRHLAIRTTKVVAVPGVAVILLSLVLAGPFAAFLNLKSSIWPVIWLGVSLAAVWQLAIPRGLLQGLQRFPSLSANLSLELVVRMVGLVVLVLAGFHVGGAMVAVLLGVVFGYALGIYSLRGIWSEADNRVRLRAMAAFSVTAGAGTLGILVLYNVDVILAKHYLGDHGASIYAALNKMGTIVYFLTLSVSQVMFPRVVEAVVKDHHPGRLLLLSAGIMCFLGAGALLIFGVVPHLVVQILFPKFPEAEGKILIVGLIGLALSLDNLLVQFFVAVHDRWFMPILAAGCILEVALIGLFHVDFNQIVLDVLAATMSLLVMLMVRYLILAPKLRPEMAVEPSPVV
jgi:O-antigen/teichoic acid export membrane protein